MKYSISYTGEEISENYSLQEKLKRDFSLDFPDFGEGEVSISEYLIKVQKIVADKKDFHIQPRIAIALMSFSNMLLVKDLDPSKWFGKNGKNKLTGNPIVRQVFEGGAAISGEGDFSEKDYNVDENQAFDLPLVFDADSSQHSALIDILIHKKNLVVEGPPGTGKSQTIANLISAAIAQGKTVLFVAEKMAALEVVKARLESAGLGNFLLELHSNKTSKKQVLESLHKRMYLNPEKLLNLDPKLDELARYKSELLRYESLINKKINAKIDLTLHQLIWRSERYRQELKDALPLVEGIRLENVENYNESSVNEGVDILVDLGNHFMEIGGYDVTQPYWGFYPMLVPPGTHRKVIELVKNTYISLNITDSVGRDLDLIAASALSSADHSLISGIAARVLYPSVKCEKSFLSKDNLSYAIDTLYTAKEGLDSIQGGYETIEAIFLSKKGLEDAISYSKSKVDEIDNLQKARLSAKTGIIRNLGKNEAFHEKVCSFNPETHKNILQARSGETISEIKKRFDNIQCLYDSFIGLQKNVVGFFRMLGCLEPSDISGYITSIDFFDIVALFPVSAIGNYSDAFSSTWTIPDLLDFVDLSSKITVLKKALEGKMYLDLLPKNTELQNAIRIFRQGDSIFRFFDQEWYSATKLYKSISVENNKCSTKEKIRDLKDLLELLELSECYSIHPAVSVFGIKTAKIGEKDLKDYLELSSWALNIEKYLEKKFNNREWPSGLKPANIATVIGSLHEIIPMAKELVSVSRDIFTYCYNYEPLFHANIFNKTELAALSSVCSRVCIKANQSIDLLEKLVGSDFVYDNLSNGVELINEVKRLDRTLEDGIGFNNIFQFLYRGVATPVEDIRKVIDIAGQLIQTNFIAQGLAAVVTTSPVKNSITQVSIALKTLDSLDKSFSKFDAEMNSIGRFELIDFLRPSLSVNQYSHGYELTTVSALAEIRYKLDSVLADPELLYGWAGYVRARASANERYMEPIVDLLESHRLLPDQLSGSYKYLFYMTLVSEHLSQNPILSRFSGIRHNKIRDEFQKIDREIIKERGRNIACKSPAVRMPAGDSGALVDSKTEGALLEHLVYQSKPRMPVRKFLKRAPLSVQMLKPCFMMGPQAVAQFLTPGAIEFDLVVMDEASQLPPEEAIGAIVRGRQLVVMGDSKQLPPTSFFSRSAVVEDESEELAVEMESILDVCSVHFKPSRMLKWHYRSKHHSLIAFSNKHFYDNNLIVFPSPYGQVGSLGVKSKFVSGAVYENQSNIREAEEVVNEIFQHIANRPYDSLGVATLNVRQKDLIEEIFYKNASLRKDVDDFLTYWNEQGQRLFVKNLENVQGDERDCIIISTTFGCAPGCNVPAQRFGPISEEGGKRRLNVLFTRARKSVFIITSLRPEHIVVDPASRGGAKYLKAYLEYARTGNLEIPTGSEGEPESDFERSVMQALLLAGFNVTPQLGVAGYRIDLAVHHPKYPQIYLAAIECDGATYHSAQSARDRDRIRQEILESMGWKDRIWRIWSTDWFITPEKELQKLIHFLNILVETWEPEHTSGSSWSETTAYSTVPDTESILTVSGVIESENSDLLDFGDQDIVEVGDRVFYVDMSDAESEQDIIISLSKNDFENRIVSRGKPIAKALLSSSIGEVVQLEIPGEKTQNLRIIRIEKTAYKD